MLENARFDAIIVGASLAGASLATLLARRGYHVLLLDRAEFPRPKICGEGVMPAGVGLLRRLGVLGEERPAWAKPFNGLRFLLPRDESIDLEFPPGRDNRGWIMARDDLDLAVSELARRQTGVEFLSGWSVSESRRDPKGVRVTARRNGQSRAFRGRVLIGADGAHSGFYRRAGIRRTIARPGRFALRGNHQALANPSARVEVFCNASGEAYVVGLPGGSARVSLLLDGVRRKGRAKSELYRELIGGFQGLGVRLSELIGSGVEARSPLAFRLDRCHGERLLLVGDAAGAVDPVTGQGMTIALRDSLLACRVLDGALGRDCLLRRDLAEFTPLRARHFEPSYRLAQQLLFLLRHPYLARRAARAIRRNPDLRQHLGAMACASQPANLPKRDILRLMIGL